MNEILPLFPMLLPCVNFTERHNLPRMSGVYFALDNRGEVLYVGATRNLQVRWKRHNQYKQLEKKACQSIAYYLCPIESLRATEQAMVLQFEPPFNSKIAQWYPSQVNHVTTKTVRPSSFRLSLKARILLQKLADRFGITQTAVLETLIRQAAKREKID